MQNIELRTRAELLYTAVEDIQQTVRAFDIKAEALILGLALPFANVKDIMGSFRTVLEGTAGLERAFVLLLVTVVAVAGGGSLLYSVRVLTGVSDPADRVRAAAPPKGAFFTGRYFRLGLIETLIGGKARSTVSLEDHLAGLPMTPAEIETQLGYEHMKLGYIVARKMALFNLGLRLFVVSGLGAAALCLLYALR
jgi:hypothetical protein